MLKVKLPPEKDSEGEVSSTVPIPKGIEEVWVLWGLYEECKSHAFFTNSNAPLLPNWTTHNPQIIPHLCNRVMWVLVIWH